MTFTVTTTKGSATAPTISAALRLAFTEPLKSAAFGPTFTNEETGKDVSVEFIDDDALSVGDAQALMLLAGGSIEDFHWPCAPSVPAVIFALELYDK